MGLLLHLRLKEVYLINDTGIRQWGVVWLGVVTSVESFAPNWHQYTSRNRARFELWYHKCMFLFFSFFVIISISRHLRSTQLCPAFGEHSVFPFVPEIVQVSTFLFHHCQSCCWLHNHRASAWMAPTDGNSSCCIWPGWTARTRNMLIIYACFSNFAFSGLPHICINGLHIPTKILNIGYQVAHSKSWLTE